MWFWTAARNMGQAERCIGWQLRDNLDSILAEGLEKGRLFSIRCPYSTAPAIGLSRYLRGISSYTVSIVPLNNYGCPQRIMILPHRSGLRYVMDA